MAANNFLGVTDEINRRVMTLFLVVDTSKSMWGTKIGAVNSSIEEMIPDLRKISESNADAEIKLAVMKFSTGCEWVTPAPVSLESFGDWEPMDVDGMTELGEACMELNAKLSHKTGFMTKNVGPFGFYAPVIILLSDGGPTDDYKIGLTALKENNWYKSALKIAIAIGSDAKKEPLEEFTENPELVIEVNNSGILKKLIKFVAVTSSQIASSSTSIAMDSSNQPGSSITSADLSDVSSASAVSQLEDAFHSFQKQEADHLLAFDDDDFD